MSETIRVIDLLNKIANGEEFPKIIKIDYITYKWNKSENKYCRQDADYVSLSFGTKTLNDEVQIIEEQEEIDIQDINNRLKRLENMVDRFEYIEKRVETIDSQSGIFRYC